MRSILLFIISFFILSCSKNNIGVKKSTIKFTNNGDHLGIYLKPENFKKGFFYFDTGSTWFIIDNSYYKKQNMSFKNYVHSEMGGIGNGVTQNIKILDTINFKIGNNNFYSEYNITGNLKDAFGKNIDGIVGFHNFRNAPFKIDYISNKIKLNPRIGDDYQEVKIRFDGYRMYLPVKICFNDNEMIEGDFIIDTGARSSSLTSEFANNKILLNNSKVKYISNGGMGGWSEGYSFFTRNMTIDKFNLTNVLLDVTIDSLGALSKNANYIGLIGNDILKKFDIIYHPSQNTIWVKPNIDYYKSQAKLFKSFIVLDSPDKNKGWFVGLIYEESDAFKKGLKHKDEILEINHKSVRKINKNKFMNNLQPNQELRLKINRRDSIFEINTHLNILLKRNDIKRNN